MGGKFIHVLIIYNVNNLNEKICIINPSIVVNCFSVSRTFRLAITLGVGLAVVSTIALIVVLVRHQKTIRRATREMQFQRLAAMNTNQYADEPRGVEMDFVKGVKYDKLPIVP